VRTGGGEEESGRDKGKENLSGCSKSPHLSFYMTNEGNGWRRKQGRGGPKLSQIEKKGGAMKDLRGEGGGDSLWRGALGGSNNW